MAGLYRCGHLRPSVVIHLPKNTNNLRDLAFFANVCESDIVVRIWQRCPDCLSERGRTTLSPQIGCSLGVDLGYARKGLIANQQYPLNEVGGNGMDPLWGRAEEVECILNTIAGSRIWCMLAEVALSSQRRFRDRWLPPS